MTPPSRFERVLALGGLAVTGALLVSAIGAWTEHTTSVRIAQAEQASAAQLTPAQRVAALKYEAEITKRRVERAEAVHSFSATYGISPELSASIYDIAKSEGIRPAIAYRLVQVESNFKRTARSSAGALGLTQIQVGTARQYDKSVTTARLMERDLNLRLGFRYLKDLLVQFDHDSHLALLAYNRGPGRVEEILAEGGNPRNGYSSAVLKAYRPTAPTRGVAN